MSAKQAVNDKLQGSVATYLRCGGVVNSQFKNGLFLSRRVKQVFKSVNIWQSYKQERDCLVHFVLLTKALLKDRESARNNHVIVCNSTKYSPISIFFTRRLSNKPFLIWLLITPPHLKYVATLSCNLSSMACFAVGFLISV